MAVIILVLVGQWINFYGNMIAFCIFKIGFSIAEVSYLWVLVCFTKLNIIAKCVILFSISPQTMRLKNSQFSFYCSVLPVDLSPQYAHFLGSLSVTVLAIGYLLNPLVMGFMVQNHVSGKLIGCVLCQK